MLLKQIAYPSYPRLVMLYNCYKIKNTKADLYFLTNLLCYMGVLMVCSVWTGCS